MLGFLRRRVFFLATLAASFGIPYAMFDPDAKSQLEALRKSLPAAPSLPKLPDWLTTKANAPDDKPALETNPALRPSSITTTSPPETPLTAANTTAANATAAGTPSINPAGLHSVKLPDLLEGPGVQDFGEVLRFDITSRWITSRWSRVTTVLSEYELEGLRVPFVSGTKLDDVAGSLTYYFDRRHRLQRITFEGLTGDERRLAAFLQNAYGMQAEPSLYAGFYASRWNAHLKSALVVRHAPVVRSDAPYRQFEIFLEINRPDDYFQLSEPVRKELERGLQSSRWGIP